MIASLEPVKLKAKVQGRHGSVRGPFVHDLVTKRPFKTDRFNLAQAACCDRRYELASYTHFCTPNHPRPNYERALGPGLQAALCPIKVGEENEASL